MQNPNSLANLQPAWARGQSGNPGGSGQAKKRVSGKFLRDLEIVYDEGGIDALRRVREEDPVAFVKALVALEPKEFKVQSAFEQLSDEQLDAAILAVESVLRARGFDFGLEGNAPAKGPAASPKPAGELPTVSQTG